MSGGTPMYPAVPLLLLVMFGLVAGSRQVPFDNNGMGNVEDISEHVPDFRCKHQGIFPDDENCDHYIVCNEKLNAYRAPCGKDWIGNLLWFVRDGCLSASNTTAACCDDPDKVECHLSPKPTQGTTPTPPSDCKAIIEGSDCDPEDVKCGQCDWCEEKVNFYFRCHQTRSSPFNPFVKTTGKWVRERCAEGWMIDSTKPLASGAVGGQCIPWLELDPEVADRWTADPDCGLVPELCEYGQEAGDACTNQYWFNLDGQPGNQRAERCKGANDIWDVDTENCRPCSDVPKCAGKGSC